MKKTFYYLYQITNLVNNKIYVGVHKTQNLNDGYMGSGKVILRAIQKHGTNNFRKDILEYFDSYQDALAREKEIVTEEFLSRKDTYNLRRGGHGGFDYINRTGKNLYGKNGQKGHGLENLAKGQNSKSRLIKEGRWKDMLSKISATLKEGYKTGRLKPNFKGKKHSAKTRAIIGGKNSVYQRGKNNSQFGTIWITNGVENKKVSKDITIPKHWRRGRTV